MCRWEFCQRGRKVVRQFNDIDTRELERAFKNGTLYGDDKRTKLSNLEIFCYNGYQEIVISSFDVTGFICQFEDRSAKMYNVSTGVNYVVTRRGDRHPVATETPFLSEEQIQRDAKMAKYREKRLEQKKKMKEAKYGNDVEGIRGSTGFIRGTGQHKWSLRWNHEPTRGGTCDGFGVCSDGCEQPGPAPTPLLGGALDGGTSVALYADGKVFHNGVLLDTLEGKRTPETVQMEKEHAAKTDTLTTITAEAAQVGNSAGTTEEKSEGESTATPVTEAGTLPPCAPLFGKGSIVTVCLDTTGGGKVKLSCGDLSYEMTDLYSKLGGSEVFPCICMCPAEQSLILSTIEGTIEGEAPSADSEEDLAPSVSQVDTSIVEYQKEEKTDEEKEATKVSSTADESTKQEEDKVAEKGSVEEKEVEVPVNKVRWMYETAEGWIVYSPEVSKDLETAMRSGQAEHSISLSTGVVVCNFQNKTQVDKGNDQTSKLRRHVVSDGIESLWELLVFKYEKPTSLSGEGLIQLLEKVWSTEETMRGDGAGLGFMFLYSLLTGDSRCRVINGFGGGGGTMGPMPKGGAYAGALRIGGTGLRQRGGNDSHRFAVLLTQLYGDRCTKSLPASTINVLCRNRQVALRMPRFKDTRKSENGVFFNGWISDSEPRSPVAELFTNVVPLINAMRRQRALHVPPSPPFDELPPPQEVYALANLSSSVHDNSRPDLTDYGCESRHISGVSAGEIRKLANSVGYKFDGGMALLPHHICSIKEFQDIIIENRNGLVIAFFSATWSEPSKVMMPMFRMASLQTTKAIFLEVNWVLTNCGVIAHVYILHVTVIYTD